MNEVQFMNNLNSNSRFNASNKNAYKRMGKLYYNWLRKKKKQDSQNSREEFHETVKRPSGLATIHRVFDVIEGRANVNTYRKGKLTGVQRSQSYYKSLFEEITSFLSEKHTKAFSDLMAQDFMMQHSASQFEKIRQKYSDKELKLFKSMLKNMDL